METEIKELFRIQLNTPDKDSYEAVLYGDDEGIFSVGHSFSSDKEGFDLEVASLFEIVSKNIKVTHKSRVDFRIKKKE